LIGLPSGVTGTDPLPLDDEWGAGAGLVLLSDEAVVVLDVLDELMTIKTPMSVSTAAAAAIQILCRPDIRREYSCSMTACAEITEQTT
jgi:hypothetical protein